MSEVDGYCVGTLEAGTLARPRRDPRRCCRDGDVQHQLGDETETRTWLIRDETRPRHFLVRDLKSFIINVYSDSLSDVTCQLV